MSWFHSIRSSQSCSSKSVRGLVSLQPGQVISKLEEDLKELYGTKAMQNILKTSRLKELVYCKNMLSNFAPIGQDRPARTLTSLNHHFVILKMTATGRNESDLITFYIRAEKTIQTRGKNDEGSAGIAEEVGKGPGSDDEGDAGIYVDLLEDKDVKRIEEWCFFPWDCASIQVPLNGLIQVLKEQDPHYNVLLRSCRNYAKETCRCVLKFLANQPNLPPTRPASYWQEQAENLEITLTEKKLDEKVDAL